MNIIISPQAKKDLDFHKKSGNKPNIKKIERIFRDLKSDPYKGEGKPEALKYEWTGFWSRRIDKYNRIIYSINDETVTVFIVSAKGHYE